MMSSSSPLYFFGAGVLGKQDDVALFHRVGMVLPSSVTFPGPTARILPCLASPLLCQAERCHWQFSSASALSTQLDQLMVDVQVVYLLSVGRLTVVSTHLL